MVDKTKVACFSGHRRLPHDCTALKENLEKTLIKLIKQGVVFFGSGGAVGFDMLAGETVLRLKKDYPYIKLILVLPCPPKQQTLKWNKAQKNRYYSILEQADKVRILSPKYTDSCMIERNRHLVDNSAHLICYLRERHGGTFYTVGYAERHCLNILRL